MFYFIDFLVVAYPLSIVGVQLISIRVKLLKLAEKVGFMT